MGKIFIKTEEEISLMQKSCEVLEITLAEVAAAIKPGMSGLQLDALAEKVVRDHGGVPSFKGYHGFPATLCISVNEEVVHGIPNARLFKDGDIISVDMGVFMNGYHGDSAYTFALGDVKEDVLQLLRVTKESLYLGIEKAIVGNRVGQISNAIQEYCERKHKYRCVRELVGHGLGKTLHEDPQVPNYGKPNDGPVLPENCTIAIEPMINLGRKDVYTKSDKWTIATQDHKPSAHFEHTICVRKEKAAILSSFAKIEAAIGKNTNLIMV